MLLLGLLSNQNLLAGVTPSIFKSRSHGMHPMHPSQGRGLVQLGSQMHHAAGLPQE